MAARHLLDTLRIAALAGLLAAPLVGCGEATPQSQARQIDTRTELIGGPSALGEVGDFLLENDHIRVVVQGPGFSRGFGVYGGGLIDMDLQRATAPGDTDGGNGRDQFGELFPIAFLQALEPDTVEVFADGSDGGTAIVRVAGSGADFISLTKALNQLVLNSHELPDFIFDAFVPENLEGDPQIGYEIFYELPPDAHHLRIRVRLTNLTDRTLLIPAELATPVLPGLGVTRDTFDAPLGFVLLFGAGNDVFTPGLGYDIRHTLDEVVETVVDAQAAAETEARAAAVAEGKDPNTAIIPDVMPFPALPGLLTNGLFTSSDTGVSYGFFSLPEPDADGIAANFVNNRVDGEGNNPYETVLGDFLPPGGLGDDTMLVPFLASSFTGVFYGQTPREFAAGESFEYSAYMAVGNGDVGSVMDTVYALRAEREPGATLVELLGQVEEETSGALLEDVSVVIYEEIDGHPRPVNQFTTDAFGRFRGTMPAGAYTARVERDPVVSAHIPFTLGDGDGARFVRLAAPAPGYVTVRVRDTLGRALPAKITVVGTVEPDAGYRNDLFDLAVGQGWRTQDVVPDDPADPKTRRYIERVEYTDAAGKVRVPVPPGVGLEVYISRGIEYSLSRAEVNVAPGEAVSLVAQLERVIDTTGWISADFHLHAAPSLDSGLDLPARVRSVVGEGVEILTATDHNFITDYGPTLLEEGLEDWATSMVGLELTTLESGHFNGFPLVRDVGRITKGAFEWSQRPPDDLFGELRRLGRHGPERTIVQVNHPRDTILGYFQQYGIDALNGGIPENLCSNVNPFECIQPNGDAFREADGMSTFSYDFDAIEVLNGSVVDQLYHLRVPEDVDRLEIPAEIKAALPSPGTIICDDGQVAFPGVLDDWFNMLNLGHRYIGTGTSDSHDADDHTGYARTYVAVEDDRPVSLSDRAIVDAFATGNVLMTNGPFVEFTVGGHTMSKLVGDELRVDADAAGGVEVVIDVQAAEWIDVDRGRIWVNGLVAETFPIELVDRRYRHETTIELTDDSWVVVEVTGDGSMFPIVRPADTPPLQLSDAFGTIAEATGLGGGADFGELAIDRVGVFTPVAITNPVYVIVGDGEWAAPGALPRSCDGYGVKHEKSARIAPADVIGSRRPPRVEPSFGLPRVKGDIQDVRTVFDQFGRHNH